MEKVILIMRIFLSLINFSYSGHMFSFPARLKDLPLLGVQGMIESVSRDLLKKFYRQSYR